MSDRGDIMDLFIIPLIVLVTFIFMAALLTIFNTLQTAGLVTGYYYDVGVRVINIFDTSLIFIVFMLIIAAAWLASQVPTHPLMVIPALIVTGVAIFAAAQVANFGYTFSQIPSFNAAANNLTNSYFLIENLPTITLAGAVVIMIALFVKPYLEKRREIYN